jgi:isocitrate dehydrogenase kinase/phosphatase
MSHPANAALSPAARRIARTILNGFESYFAKFQDITIGAKGRFEAADWQAVHHANIERLDLYKAEVNRVARRAQEVSNQNIFSLELWRAAKPAFAQFVAPHFNYEIAETFFNSVFCRIFAHEHIHHRHMFVLPSRPLGAEPLVPDDICTHYDIGIGLVDLFSRILADFAFAVPWENKRRDVSNIVAALRARFGHVPIDELHIDMLESIFYRNKAAYLVGRASIGGKIFPLILPCLNNEKGGIYVDTVIFDSDVASIVFSFTRSYFMVDAPIPSRYVPFLQSLMPQKSIAELYNAVGFNKHGKTEFYRHIIEHMRKSDDKFIVAPGIRGMVMTVFTLPSYDMVFKVIKDRFDPPKQVTEEIVREKYRFVSRADRAGRMADTQEYSNFIFYRNRFSEELIDELKRVAPSKLVLADKWIIIKHLYTERRMEPLNLFLQHATEPEIDAVMDEYGNAIKQMAGANIFPGDMLLKNFGVTRHGRVVFYDYDEVCALTDCNFRRIPESTHEEDEMSATPWYSVGENDVFPEEFRLFFSGNPRAKAAFEAHHADIYDYRYWQQLQQSIRDGRVFDTFPYRRSSRFAREETDRSGFS